MKGLIIFILGLVIFISGCATIRPMTEEEHKRFEEEWKKEKERKQTEPYIPHPRDFKKE